MMFNKNLNKIGVRIAFSLIYSNHFCRSRHLNKSKTQKFKENKTMRKSVAIMAIAMIVTLMVATPLFAQGVTGGSAGSTQPNHASGTSSDANSEASGVFNFYSPPGPTGATGARGSTGSRGATGSPGADGIGILSATVGECGHLWITLTDGRILDAGVVRGLDGLNGVGITNAMIGQNGHLYLMLSNGQQLDAGQVTEPLDTKNKTDWSWLWWLLIPLFLLVLWVVRDNNSENRIISVDQANKNRASYEQSERDRIKLGDKLIDSSVVDTETGFSAEFKETGRAGTVSFKIRRGNVPPADLDEMFERKFQQALAKHAKQSAPVQQKSPVQPSRQPPVDQKPKQPAPVQQEPRVKPKFPKKPKNYKKDDLEGMTVAQLMGIVRSRGLQPKGKGLKADIVREILDNQ
ncbi:collagen-like protein [Patescibacteria group bacterium]